MKRLLIIIFLFVGCKEKYDWSKSELASYEQFYKEYPVIYESRNVLVLKINDDQYDVFYIGDKIGHTEAYQKLGATLTVDNLMIIHSDKYNLQKIKNYFNSL